MLKKIATILISLTPFTECHGQARAKPNIDNRITHQKKDFVANCFLKWKFNPKQSILYSSVLVSKGVVYTGNLDGYLYAVDEHSGVLKWKFKTKGWPVKWIRTSPVLSSGLIFVGNAYGNLHAVEANTGKERWAFSAKQMIVKEFSPIVYNGTVIYSADGETFALDEYTGKLQWKKDFSNKPNPNKSGPRVCGGVIIFINSGSCFHAFDLKTGASKWKFIAESKAVNWSTVTLDNTLVFGCSNSNIYALDVQTGKLKWKLNVQDATVNADPVKSDHIALFGDNDSYIYALDMQAGILKWRMKCSKVPPKYFSIPFVWGDLVVFNVYRNTYVLDNRAGQERWRLENKTTLLVKDSLVFAERYYGEKKPGAIAAFNASTGKEEWVFKVTGTSEIIEGIPGVSDNTVFFNTRLVDASSFYFLKKSRGYLYALEYKK